MKTLRKLCAAVTLLLVLSLSAIGGEISTDVVKPPPPPAGATATVMEPGEINSDAPKSTIESAPGLLSEITLSFLRLLAVF